MSDRFANVGFLSLYLALTAVGYPIWPVAFQSADRESSDSNYPKNADPAVGSNGHFK